MFKQSRFLPGFIACLILLTGNVASAARTPTQQYVSITGHRFEVEIADTDATREHGLMFRTHLAADHGMLFVYPDARIRTFWMKNTLIPLDILFFDAHKQLINISADTPPCKSATCPTFSSAAPARYVLELHSGVAKKSDFKPGAALVLSR